MLVIGAGSLPTSIGRLLDCHRRVTGEASETLWVFREKVYQCVRIEPVEGGTIEGGLTIALGGLAFETLIESLLCITVLGAEVETGNPLLEGLTGCVAKVVELRLPFLPANRAAAGCDRGSRGGRDPRHALKLGEHSGRSGQAVAGGGRQWLQLEPGVVGQRQGGQDGGGSGGSKHSR